MRLRLPLFCWLVLLTMAIIVGGSVFHFWSDYQRVQRFVADTKALDGDVTLQSRAPQWLEQWAIKNKWEAWIQWLKTDVTHVTFGMYEDSNVSFDSFRAPAEIHVDDAWVQRMPRFRNLETLILGRMVMIDTSGLSLPIPPPTPTDPERDQGRDLSLLSGSGFPFSLDSKITDLSLQALSIQTGLEILYLDETRISDEGLKSPQRLPHLRVLSLRQTAIADAGLATLATYPDLRWINLEKTAVTDRGLESLKSLTHLHSLRLTDTQVSDVGLDHLASHSNLEYLMLRGTRVTSAGVARLQKRIPALKMDLR